MSLPTKAIFFFNVRVTCIFHSLRIIFCLQLKRNYSFLIVSTPKKSSRHLCTTWLVVFVAAGTTFLFSHLSHLPCIILVFRYQYNVYILVILVINCLLFVGHILQILLLEYALFDIFPYFLYQTSL